MNRVDKAIESIVREQVSRLTPSPTEEQIQDLLSMLCGIRYADEFTKICLEWRLKHNL